MDSSFWPLSESTYIGNKLRCNSYLSILFDFGIIQGTWQESLVDRRLRCLTRCMITKHVICPLYYIIVNLCKATFSSSCHQYTCANHTPSRTPGAPSLCERTHPRSPITHLSPANHLIRLTCINSALLAITPQLSFELTTDYCFNHDYRRAAGI